MLHIHLIDSEPSSLVEKYYTLKSVFQKEKICMLY